MRISIITANARHVIRNGYHKNDLDLIFFGFIGFQVVARSNEAVLTKFGLIFGDGDLGR
jgi:hypothetical protein